MRGRCSPTLRNTSEARTAHHIFSTLVEHVYNLQNNTRPKGNIFTRDKSGEESIISYICLHITLLSLGSSVLPNLMSRDYRSRRLGLTSLLFDAINEMGTVASNEGFIMVEVFASDVSTSAFTPVFCHHKDRDVKIALQPLRRVSQFEA
jgi:hypothetical protein